MNARSESIEFLPGTLDVVKNGRKEELASLRTDELVGLLCWHNATLDQVQALMELLWDREPEELDRPLLNVLEGCESLAARVVATSLLRRAHGNKAGLYDFEEWKVFLEGFREDAGRGLELRARGFAKPK